MVLLFLNFQEVSIEPGKQLFEKILDDPGGYWQIDLIPSVFFRKVMYGGFVGPGQHGFIKVSF